MKQNEDRKRLDYERSQAAQFGVRNYSREERYLIILSRDLQKEHDAICALGIMKADLVLQTSLKDSAKQLYFDFVIDFERLKTLMNEFRWTKDFLRENGIDFAELRKLYFSVA